MPRPFIVEIYIEESSFGSVMRKLDNMEGVISINWDADRERGSKSKPNGEHHSAGKPRPQYEKPGRDVLYEALYKKSPLTTSGIKDAFEAAGRPATSMASVLHLAKNQGDVIRTEEGYVLTKKARDRMRKRK